jgi:hypothetical protein
MPRVGFTILIYYDVQLTKHYVTDSLQRLLHVRAVAHMKISFLIVG